MPDRSTNDLITNLRFRASWIDVCRIYITRLPKPEVKAFLQDMMEVDQAAVDELARALRKLDVPPASVGIDNTLVSQVKTRRTWTPRLRFIEQGLATSTAWYQTKLAEPRNPHQTLWQELYEQQLTLAEKLDQIVSS